MSIKTWQERLAKITSTSYQGYASQEEIDACKQAELDEIRSELARRTGEIAQLTETSLWQAGRISELLDDAAAQRKVLEQALEALNDITAEISMKRFWREKDEKRFDEIAGEAITAIQEQLA